MGTPAAVKVGPGLLYVAPIGTAEPASPTAALPSAWVPVGYTDSGHVFTPNVTFEDIEVAEELDPIRTMATRRQTMIEFAMAEMDTTKASIAFNGGTIGTPAGGYVSFEPPDLGDEERLMMWWASDDGEEALLLRRVLQVGSVATARNKAPNKATFPVQFRLEKPLDGAAIFKKWYPSALSYTDPH